jgi:hypothetical protein
MKKFLSFFVIFLFAFSVVACQGQTTQASVTTGTTQTTQTTAQSNDPLFVGIPEDSTIEVQAGATSVPLIGILVTDEEDGDLTSSIIVGGTYDLNVVGEYSITLTVTDSDGNVVTENITLVVTGTDTEPVLAGVKDQFVALDGTFNPLVGVSASDAEDGDLTSSVTQQNNVDTSVVGSYRVEYTVEDSNGNEVTQTSRVFVVDNAYTVNPETGYVYAISPTDEVGRQAFNDLWILGTSGQALDIASTQGGNAGILELHGTDGGMYNEDPNAWAAGYFSLPDADELEMKFALSNGGNEGQEQSIDTWFRVVILSDDGRTILEPTSFVNVLTEADLLEVELFDEENGWYRLKSAKFSVNTYVTYDLSDFAGEDVVIVLEQGDNGNGVGEYAYIYNLVIGKDPNFVKVVNAVDVSAGKVYNFATEAEFDDFLSSNNSTTGVDYAVINSKVAADWTVCLASGDCEGDQLAIVLAGQDTEATNLEADSWVSIEVILGTNQFLRFVVGTDTGAANFAVIVIEEDGTETILTNQENGIFQSLPGGYNVGNLEGNYDLSAWDGETVTIKFLYDQDETSGSRIFLDSISFGAFVNDLPEINGIQADSTITVVVGATAIPLVGITANDFQDGDLTSSLTVVGAYDLDTIGTYNLTLSVTDSDGGVTTLDFTLDVIATDDPATINGINPISVIQGSTFDPLAGVTATDSVDGNLTSSIQVSGTVDTAVLGDVTLTYTVTDSFGNVTTETRVVTVIEDPGYTDVSGNMDFKFLDDSEMDYFEVSSEDTSQSNYVVYNGVIDAGWNICLLGGDCDAAYKALVMSGIDEDSEDLTANSWISIRVLLGTNQFLRFVVSTDAGAANFAVMVIEEDGTETILTTQENGIFQSLPGGYNNGNLLGEYDLSAWNGEVVTIKFLYDQDETTASRIFLDTISFGSFINALPVISGIQANDTITVIEGATEIPLDGITATDAQDGDLTSSLTVVGTYDLNTVGTYNLTLSVTDSHGGVTTLDFVLNVSAADQPATISGVEDITIYQDSVFDPLAGITASDDLDGDLTSSIVLTGSVDTTVLGEVTLTYTVTDTGGNVTTVSRVVTVVVDPGYTDVSADKEYKFLDETETLDFEFSSQDTSQSEYVVYSGDIDENWLICITGGDCDPAYKALVMSGIDSDPTDLTANSWVSIKVLLGNFQNLRFAVSTDAAAANFAVKVIEEDGTETILTLQENGIFQSLPGVYNTDNLQGDYDLSAWNGQVVTIMFLYDQDETTASRIFLDYIRFVTVGPDYVDVSADKEYKFLDETETMDFEFSSQDTSQSEYVVYNGDIDSNWNICIIGGDCDGLQKALVMSGIDSDPSDLTANSWVSIKVLLGSSQHLKFTVSTDAAAANFAVKVIEEDGTETILTLQENGIFQSLPGGYNTDNLIADFDLSQWNGEVVTIMFLYDQDETTASRIFLDYIRFE